MTPPVTDGRHPARIPRTDCSRRPGPATGAVGCRTLQLPDERRWSLERHRTRVVRRAGSRSPCTACPSASDSTGPALRSGSAGCSPGAPGGPDGAFGAQGEAVAARNAVRPVGVEEFAGRGEVLRVKFRGPVPRSVDFSEGLWCTTARPAPCSSAMARDPRGQWNLRCAATNSARWRGNALLNPVGRQSRVSSWRIR